MSYTKREVQEAVEAVISSGREWDGIGYFDITLRGETIRPKVVTDFGGEGQGSNRYIVFRIGDQLFRKSGYYASYHGSDWDGDFDEVEEYERTITDYRVKN